MNILIIDDETKARSLLSTILKENAIIQLQLFEAANLLDGVAIIEKNAIDIVFLDIEMPNHSGLQLFDFIDISTSQFEIIFTTAYNEYALAAFEFSAIDYLLKPIRPSKVIIALEKAIKSINLNQVQERLQELKNNLLSKKFSKIALPVEDGVLFVKLDEICFLQAESMYTYFNLTNQRKILISKPLKYFSDLLEDKELFYKPHRSYLVNLQYLQKVVKRDGTYLEMESNERIPVSKEKREELYLLLNELR